MFIRKKIARGRTYYQIVEGRREDGAVYQYVLCSLGRSDDPGAVLQSKTRSLAQHKRELAEWDRVHPAGGDPVPRSALKRRDQLRRRIEGLTQDVKVIRKYLKRPLVGTTTTK